MTEIITNILALIGLAVGLVLTGMGVGLGIAIGFEIVMRASGSGRTVLLTWARTKVEAPDE